MSTPETAELSEKSGENIRSRRKDILGREFIVENPDREVRQFDTNSPDAMAMVMAHCDWLAEQGCMLEAELMMADWGVRVGHLAMTDDLRKRVEHLRNYFGIKSSHMVHRKVEGQRGRQQTITLFLQEPIGAYYTKATVNILHMEHFLKELESQPIMSLCMACNGTSAPGLVHKYLNYVWLRKVETLDLNNLEVPFVELRSLFHQSVIEPKHLKITGKQKQLPTKQQLQLLPRLAKHLRFLETIEYHGEKYDYRYSLEEQPK